MEPAYDVEPMPPGDLNHLCGVTVSIQLGTKKSKHYCKCRGVSGNSFILIQQPPSATAKNQLAATRDIVVRYVLDGAVWGFKSTIIRVMDTPFDLVFIAFPDRIERYSLRACERTEVVIQAEFSISGLVIKSIIRDLSGSGCRLVILAEDRGNLPLHQLEQSGILTFLTDIPEERVSVECKVVRIASDRERTELGIAFDESNKATLDKITRFVDHVMGVLA